MQAHGLSLWVRWIFNLPSLTTCSPPVCQRFHRSAGARSATDGRPASNGISTREVAAIAIAPTVDGASEWVSTCQHEDGRRRGRAAAPSSYSTTRTRSHGWHPSQSTAIQGNVHSRTPPPQPPPQDPSRMKDKTRIKRAYFEPPVAKLLITRRCWVQGSAWQQNGRGKKWELIVVIITEFCFHAAHLSIKTRFLLFVQPARLAWTTRSKQERFLQTAEAKGLMRCGRRSGKNISGICFWIKSVNADKVRFRVFTWVIYISRHADMLLRPDASVN